MVAITFDDCEVPMNFALIGSEPDVMSLLAAIQASPQHNLVAAYGEVQLAVDDEQAAIGFQRALGAATVGDDWESLLIGSIADVVIACRGVDTNERAEQLRKLAQAGIPLIVLHPIGDAVLAFELLMIQQDAGGLIVPYQPAIDHPVWTQLVATRQSDNRTQQLSIERPLRDQTGQSVKQQFARDAMVIRQLMGRIDHINALAATQNRDEYSGLSVQMSDQYGAVARWALLPTSDESDDPSRWKVHHTDGTSSTAAFPADVERWTLDSNASVRTTSAEAASAFLRRFAGDVQRHANAQPLSRPDWEDACRSIELVENIDISRRRKKTVSLYYEEISEENTFKSLMAAGGCLLLLLLTLSLPALAALESIFRSTQDVDSAAATSQFTESDTDGIRQPSSTSPFLTNNRGRPSETSWFGKWPLLLFAILVLFICLQFLRFVTRPHAGDSKSRQPPETPG